MNITLRLGGIPEEIIDEMIKAGVASTKTEAIRVAIMDYNEHHPLKKFGLSEKEEKEAETKIQASGWKAYLEDKREDDTWKKYL